MANNAKDLGELLKSLDPQLHDGAYAFCAVHADADVSGIGWIALFREAEGLTVVVSEEVARAQGWTIAFRAAWITLRVYSDLEAVGLTSAVAHALATAG